MALPTPECWVLRRSYVWRLVREEKRLRVATCPTGILVVLNNPVIGFATKKPGQRRPWTSIRRRVPTGSFLVPRLIYLRHPLTIALFTHLNETSPPATEMLPFGEGQLLPGYLMVSDIQALRRQQKHILDDGYGVTEISKGQLSGEAAELYSILDQLEISLDLLLNWRGLSPEQKEKLAMTIAGQAVILERAVDPNKVRVYDHLLPGLRDRLNRLNPLIATLNLQEAREFTDQRLQAIAGISGIITNRRTWVEQYDYYLSETIKWAKRRLTTAEKMLGTGQEAKRLRNALIETATILREKVYIRPYRCRARWAAALARQAAEKLLSPQPTDKTMAQYLIKIAIVHLQRVPQK